MRIIGGTYARFLFMCFSVQFLNCIPTQNELAGCGSPLMDQELRVVCDARKYQKIKTCETTHGNRADSVSVGSLASNHCAVFQGKVKCWGQNQQGLLGLGDFSNRGDDSFEMGSCLKEIKLGTAAQVTSVSVSELGSRCALFSNGKVKCWGANLSGQLGLGDIFDRSNLSDLGDILPYVDLGTGVTAVKLAAGKRNYCAILNNGQIKCWGAFSTYPYYSLNPGFIGDQPYEMGDYLGYSYLPAGRYATQIAMSSGPTCAVLDDGSIYCWNRVCTPDSGLFNGPTYSCNDVSPVPWMPLGQQYLSAPVQSISMGDSSACVLFTNGKVSCWGDNFEGQLGYGDTVGRFSALNSLPYVNLGTGRTATKITLGAAHACALLDNNAVKCWGKNQAGQLGLGDLNHRGDQTNEMGDFLLSVDLGTGRTATDIQAGMSQTCAILDDQTVKCWGMNQDGRLGQGDTLNRGTMASSMGDALRPIELW